MTGRNGSTGSAPRPDPPVNAAVESVPGYRDLARIGHGGFSVVYRAVQESFERAVALKVLTVGTDEEARRRFLREVRLASRLSGHPHVVTILDAGMTASGRPYLAMDLYDGGSMKERLKRSGPISAAEAAVVGAKIADALAAAHSLGVLHRDVTPNNILVSKFGEPALADFGVSCLLDSSSSASIMDIFSPQHAAPELMTRGVPTAASDIYALGSSLYQLLTGRPPFDGENRDVRSIMWRTVSEPAPRPDCPELPELADAIVRALAKEPGQRFSDAAEFARTLRALIPEGTPSALAMPTVVETRSAVGPATGGTTHSHSASGSGSRRRPVYDESVPTGEVTGFGYTSSATGRRRADETMVRPDRSDPIGTVFPAGDDGDKRRGGRVRRARIPVAIAVVVALLGVGVWALLESQHSSSNLPIAEASHSATATAAAFAAPTQTPTRHTASPTPTASRSSAPAVPAVTKTTVHSHASASASPSPSSSSAGSLLPLPGTYHRLQNAQSGDCLTQSGSSAAQAGCASSRSQGWQYSLSINGLLSGDYELINKQSGQCLTVGSGGRVSTQACDGATSQLWAKSGGSGSSKEFQSAGNGQCLQASGAVVSYEPCSTSDRTDLWNEDGTV